MAKLRIFVSPTIVLILRSAFLIASAVVKAAAAACVFAAIILTFGAGAPLCAAAPNFEFVESETKGENPAGESSAEAPGPAIHENMVVSPAPPPVGEVVPPESPRYYTYRQALTFRAGVASDFPKLSFSDGVLGFEYLFPKFLSPKLEAGADLHESGRGHVHAGVRWIYFERSYFRPSVKLALDHYVDGRYGLGTLARKEDWFARGSATLEHVVWSPFSLRLEGEGLINFDHTALVVTLAISRGW